MAPARVPQLARLGLDAAGMPLTPLAVFERKVTASNMLEGTTIVADYDGVPIAVFTVPELARVGVLEDDARAGGLDIDLRCADTSGWYSHYRVGERTAAMKILVDRGTDRTVGCWRTPICSCPARWPGGRRAVRLRIPANTSPSG